MKSSMQVGFNSTSGRFTVSQPGEGQISLSYDEIDEIVSYVVEQQESEKKDEKNESSTDSSK